MFARRIVAVVALFALAVSGCSKSGGSGGGGGGGGGGVTNPPPSGSSPMSATIDGTAWQADPLTSGQGAMLFAPGAYSISGFKPATGATTWLTFNLWNIGGTGTFPLGVGTTNFGGGAQTGNSFAGWSTPLTGASGSVTITTLTATRIAGTFNFTASPVSGSATGIRNVTQGTFDYPIIVSGTGGDPLPDHAGSVLSATIDGVPWNAATIANTRVTNAGGVNLITSGLNNAGLLTWTKTGTLTPGTYDINNIPPFCMMIVSDSLGTPRYGGTTSLLPGGAIASNDSGTVVITSVTPTRVQGTFSGKLAPAAGSSATGFLTVTDGTFNLGTMP